MDWIKNKDLKFIGFSWAWECLLIFLSSYFFIKIANYLLDEHFKGEIQDIGFLVAGVIAALVSILISFNNKESELNKYRMKWCDDVRNLTHSYIAEVNAIYSTIALLGVDCENEQARLINYHNSFVNDLGVECLRSVEEKGVKIDLFLKNKGSQKTESSVYRVFNNLNDEFLEVVSLIDVYGRDFKSGARIDNVEDKVQEIDARFNRIDDDFIEPVKDSVNSYLNDEWSKIKHGSFLFRFKRALMVALIFSIFIVAVGRLGA